MLASSTEISAYGNLTEIKTRRLGNLAIVAPLLERMNVKKIFNKHLPSGTQLDFDYGTFLELLIAARLFGPTPLSRVTEWAEESGADLAFCVPSEKLNDDRLGRAFGREQRAETYDQGEMSVVGDADLQANHISKGKPVDDAPTGYRMAHFGLATFVVQYGQDPMTRHMLDGNENGRSGVAVQVENTGERRPLSRGRHSPG